MAAMRYFCGTIERETDKAVCVNYIYHVDICNPDVEYAKTVWLPKSQIEVYHQFTDGDKSTVWRVPPWLCTKNHMITIPKRTVDSLIAK